MREHGPKTETTSQENTSRSGGMQGTSISQSSLETLTGNATENQTYETNDDGPKNLTPADVNLSDLKSGKYNGNPQKMMEVAQDIQKAIFRGEIKVSENDQNLLRTIMNSEGNFTVNPFNTYENVVKPSPERTYEKDYKRKNNFTEKDVQNAAWLIVQTDNRVKDALLFYGQIKNNEDPDKWNAELELFFTGPRAPKLQKQPLGVTSGTPVPHFKNAPKKVWIDEENSFPVSVSSYLHEVVHYMDMWYSSRKAKKEKKQRREGDKGPGIKQYKTANEADKDKRGMVDLTVEEQKSALTEYVSNNIEKILKDIQREFAGPDEHPLTEEFRNMYWDWYGPRRDVNFDGASKEEQQKQIDSELGKIRKKINRKVKKAYGKRLFDKQWGLAFDKETGTMSAKGVELGFAFEKQAYGFYDPTAHNADWSVNFNQKFEKKYWRELE